MSEKPVAVSCKQQGCNNGAENMKLLLMVALTVIIYSYIYFQLTAVIGKSLEMDNIAEINAGLTRRMNRLSELDYNMSVTLEKLRDSYTRRMAVVKMAEERCFNINSAQGKEGKPKSRCSSIG